MKKKKWIAGLAAVAVLLVLAVVLWLTADRSDTVGICYRDSAGVDNAAYRQQLQQALTAQGYEVIVTDADGDQAKQLALIGELSGKKCDVLLVEPVMQDAAQELLAEIGKTELPAVLFNRQIDTALLASYPQIAYIAWDENQPGQLQAKLLQDLPAGGDVNGDGTVSYMLIQGPKEYRDAVARTQSFEAQLQSNGLTVQQLVLETGDWSVESGRRICKQQLAAFGKDIEVIVCGNDKMAAGAALAIADGGRTVGADVYLLAIGGGEDTLAMIADGTLSGTVYSDPKAQIDAITETVKAKFNEQPAEPVQILPYIPITADNAKQYLEN